MNWPNPGEIEAKPFAKRERRASYSVGAMEDERERRDWRDFEERLKLYPKETAKALRTILAAVDGDEFAAWAENMTGRPASEIVPGFRRMVIRSEWNATKVRALNDHLCIWETIRLSDRNYLRGLWADELNSARAGDRRRLLMRLATPPWADSSEIVAVYRLRDEMTEETGIAHHVDHIVPIQHPLVCGLNCAANLRVVTAAENLRKNNRFVPGEVI